MYSNFMDQTKKIYIAIAGIIIFIGIIFVLVLQEKQKNSSLSREDYNTLSQQYNIINGQIKDVSDKLVKFETRISDLEKIKKDELKKTSDENDVFQSGPGSYFGILILKGYAEVKKNVPDCFDDCEDPATPKVDVVSFRIVYYNNNAFTEYIQENSGNSFVGDVWIGLGCLSSDKKGIESDNDGDFGNVNNLISGDDFKKLMGSNKSNPINLQVTKPYYTSGRGATTCYSHFRNFKVK